MALNHYKRTEHIIVRNCLLNHGHGSVTVGSECAGGVTDVHVDRCIFRETDRGLRIKTRRGRGARSVLDEIKGIGPARRNALLNRFGSVEKIRKATAGQLQETDGITESQAREIYDFFHKE